MILDSLMKLNREKGVTVIITSSELAELRSVCNRIAIVTEGKIAGILSSTDEDYKYGMLMSGVKLQEAPEAGSPQKAEAAEAGERQNAAPEAGSPQKAGAPEAGERQNAAAAPVPETEGRANS